MGKKTNESIAPSVESDNNFSLDIGDSIEKKLVNVEEIIKIDKNFSEDKFLLGAKDAFKMIVNAFQERNIEKVKFLLTSDVYENFANEAAFLSSNNGDRNIISSVKAKILEINILKTNVFIKVEFLSNQKNNKKDKENSKDKEIKDIWIFSKDLKDSNPNWKLKEVSSS